MSILNARFRHLWLTVVATILSLQLYAQDSTYTPQPTTRQTRQQAKRNRMNNALRMEEEGDLIFNRQNVFGIRLATDGYGLSFEKGYFRTPTRTFLWDFELNEKHSQKEHHVSAGDGFDFSSVVPYKLNNLYEFKVSVGQQILIGGKGNKNGVAVSAIYAGGLSLGMLKPYYITVQNAVSYASNQMTYAQFAKDTILGDEVAGAAGFLVGWDNLTVKPGVNGRQAMRFDYGRLNQTVAAIEVGLTEEFYFGKMPIMYLVPAKQFFFNAYVSILFGGRK
ncbi:MAG TPA: hypothetical protein VMH27_16920 [Puia sp.]|nr:hypothetical protein [Puia sp.]